MRWSPPRVRLAAAAGIGWVALSWTAGNSFTTTAFGVSSSRSNRYHHWKSKSVVAVQKRGSWVVVLGSSAGTTHSRNEKGDIPEVIESPVLRQVYPALVEFFQEYGHADIPLKSTAGKQCKTLRRLATQGKLTEDETALLTSLQFRFNSLEQVYEEADFRQLFQRLVAYEKETQSGYDIPKKYKPDPELGAWVTALRRLGKRDLIMNEDNNNNNDDNDDDDTNNNSLLRLEHVEQLNLVGFTWISHRQCGSAFMLFYRQLVDRLEHQQQQQSNDDDNDSPIKNVWDDPEVQKWLHAQRVAHSKGLLYETRVGYLNELNIDWMNE
eukprot:scaffold422093_cov71-Attheya_sp.AAC.2